MADDGYSIGLDPGYAADGSGGIGATSDAAYTGDSNADESISTPTLADSNLYTTDALLPVTSLAPTGVAASSGAAKAGEDFISGLSGLLGDAAGVAAQLYVQPALAASALKSQTAANTAAAQLQLQTQAGLASIQQSTVGTYFTYILIGFVLYIIAEKA